MTPLDPVTVELTLMEFLVTVETAKTRMVASAMQQINHATTYDRTWVRRLHEETVGACGEIAVGKYLGAWFVPSVNTFHRVPDCLENVEVRSTDIMDGSLIVRDNDADDRRFILALVEGERVQLAGWIDGAEAKREEWKRNPNGYRLAWFVPQGALRPMGEIGL
jgi:hypothetical protein